MRRILLVLSILCLSFMIARADTQPVKEDEKERDYHNIIDDFFALAKDQQLTQAADGLFADVLVSRSPDISSKGYFDEVKAKLIDLPNIYGTYCYHSRMFERMVAKRLVFVDYIVLFEKQPVEFSFEFYKPKEKWMLYGFSLDTNIVNKLDSKIREKLLISDTKLKD